MSKLPPTGFRDLTNIALEFFIATLTLLPFLILSYFYSSLPQQIPEYLHLNGEVAVWGRKSLFSVFRLALMGLDLQLLAFFMKYGLWQRYLTRLRHSDRLASAPQRLMSGLADWLRAMVGIKLFVSSVEVIFLTNEKYQSLATAARAISWISSILGVIGAGCYFYSALKLKRKLKPESGRVVQPLDQTRVRGGIFYYNSADPALFVDKYLFNLANLGTYVFLLCLLCLPLLMFLPMLQ
jgi:uncharacterized membrane protein